jgi:hypothetical protein
VARLSPDAQQLLLVTPMPGEVHDLDLDRARERVVVVGPFGVSVIDMESGALIFAHALAGARRVAVGSAGSVAVLASGEVHVFAPDGTARGRFGTGAGTARDLVVDDATGAIAVGGDLESEVPSRCSAPLPVAFVRAFDHAGQVRWRAWDFPAERVVELGGRRCAHSRVRRLALGRDDKLYVAGDSYGGDTPFALDPADPTRLAANVGYDAYTTPLGVSRREPIGYLARLHLQTGRGEVGQFLLGRNGAGQASSVSIRALAADRDGRVLIAGRTACCLSLEARQVAVGAARPHGFVALIAPSFRERRSWTSATSTVALSDDVAAVPPESGLGEPAAWLALLALDRTERARTKQTTRRGH